MSDKNGILLQLKYGYGSAYKKKIASGRSISQIVSRKRQYTFNIKNGKVDVETPLLPTKREAKSCPPPKPEPFYELSPINP